MLVPLIASSTSQRFVRPDHASKRTQTQMREQTIGTRHFSSRISTKGRDVRRRKSISCEDERREGILLPKTVPHRSILVPNDRTALDRGHLKRHKRNNARALGVLCLEPCGYSLSRNRPTVPAIFDIITVERARMGERERKRERQPPVDFSYTFERESCLSFSPSAQIALKRTEQKQTSIKVVNGEP